MKKFLALAICLALSMAVQAQEKLTYEEAIATALDYNFGIKIAKNNQAIAENNVSYGNAGFMPVLTLDANRTYGRQNFERQLATGQEQTQSGARSLRTAWSANANWTIFDGLRMFRRYDQLIEVEQQSEDDLRNQVELLIFNVSAAYYQAALEKERLRLSENNIDLSEERLRIAKEKYELGKASKLEYLQAQVDLNADKSAQIRQVQVLDLRKLDLLQLMTRVKDSIDFEIDFQLEQSPKLDLADLINQLETSNPQLLALRRDQTIAQYEKEINQSERYPQVDLFASYAQSNSESPAGFAIQNKSKDLSYGLSATWTVFNGFNLNRRIQNAKIQMENSQYAYEDQLNTLITNLRSRYISYSNSLNLMELEKENVEVAKENNDIAQERYRIGLSNPVELREAQINLINAELRLQNAAFDAKLAEIELNYLSGQLMTGN